MREGRYVFRGHIQALDEDQNRVKMELIFDFHSPDGLKTNVSDALWLMVGK